MMLALRLAGAEGSSSKPRVSKATANASSLLVAALVWFAGIMYARECIDAGEAPMMKYIGETLLHNERIFLYGNITYDKDYTILPFRGQPYYPRPIDSLFSISVALIILALRILYNKHVGKLLVAGGTLNLSGDGNRERRRRKPAENRHLEAWYRGNSNPSSVETEAAARRAGVSTTYVQNWLRKRRNCDKKPTAAAAKFCESSFKFIYYFSASWCGAFSLWNKDWFPDTTEYHTKIHMVDQLQEMEADIFIYYQIAMGFYWSLFISQFTDTRRKDFWTMFAHHVVTLLLLVGSFSTGWHRIGTIVLATHDVADWTLELMKVSVYLQREVMSRVGVTLLVVSWLTTRLIYYPLYVIPIGVDACANPANQCTAGHHAFIALLCALVPLHAIWFYYLCRGVYRYAKFGNTTDTRSDTEGEDREGEEEEPHGEMSSDAVSNGVVAKKLELDANGNCVHRGKGVI